MNSRERMAAAMRHEQPDRVPVMCQLSLGHYFLHSGLDPVDIWHDSHTFGDTLLTLQRDYHFDGVLVNLPGRPTSWREQIVKREQLDGEVVLEWQNGRRTVVPPDDLPIVQVERPLFDDIVPSDLWYVEPYDLTGLTLLKEPHLWQTRTLEYVRAQSPEISVHAEIFSPFTQLLELVDYANALMALIDDPPKVKACLSALCEGTVHLMLMQAGCGADAILISSAFAGAGFIGREHYREFVLPYEQRIISDFHLLYPDVPVYTHTCGAIGDRLGLMEETGTNGIDTLDPPPLGTVEFRDAVRQLGGKLFLKGNLDAVNTLLRGTPADVYAEARERLQLARDTYGYILSTSCSVAPHTPPENILELKHAVDDHGRYQ